MVGGMDRSGVMRRDRSGTKFRHLFADGSYPVDIIWLFPNRSKKMRTLFLIILVAALSGCALFSSPKEQPVMEDHADSWFGVAKTNVFSTTAERREVIVKFPDNKFCAEPPPDVAESLVSGLTMLAQGSAKDKTAAEVSARLEATRTLATSIRTLFTRSQGAQFLRDGLFHLCQAYLNHAVNAAEYSALYRELLTKSQALVVLELPDMKDKRAADAVSNADAAATEAKAAASAAAVSAQQAKQAADRADAAAKKSEPNP